MAQEPLNEDRYDAGHTVLDKLEQAGVPIEAALWAFKPGVDEWRLIIVTPRFDRDGPRALLRRAARVLESMNGETSIDLFAIDFYSPLNPMIIDLHHRISSFTPRDRRSPGRLSLQNTTVGSIRYDGLEPYFTDLQSPFRPATRKRLKG